MSYRSFARRLAILLLALVAGLALAATGQGELQVAIESVPEDLVLTNDEREIDVDGRASVFGGLKHLELFLVLDASESLLRTDPDDYRLQGATALVQALPPKSDIQLGIVAFDDKATLVSPLTKDRASIVEKLKTIGRAGGTNLHDGIRLALAGFDERARKDSLRVILLFTDGKSDHAKAIEAAQEANRRSTVIHSLLLLDKEKAADLLQTIAGTTRGTFLRVDDPQQLPQAFLALRTTGVDHVKLRVNRSAALDTHFMAGTFNGRVPLRPGKNVISATATDLEGAERETSVTVTVTGPLRVAIARPIDGTLLTERQTSTEVEVNASVFREPTADLVADFPQLGVESVTLAVRGAPPIPTRFVGGKFVGRVPLELQANRIVASARSFDGRTAETAVDVTVRPPGCGALSVAATRDGQPALSINDRGLEFIFDASNSMWGQIAGVPKITIAKDAVREILTGLPADIHFALRVYGHQHAREKRNCTDSELLITLGPGQAEQVRGAIDGFKPRGQTPLGYSVEQVPADFGEFRGERAVVLLTDGVESCDGDAVAAARAFQAEGRHRPVHVIGFGLEPGEEQAVESLRQIATSTGGKFIEAQDGEALRRALSEATGTRFTVERGGVPVASGSLGAGERFLLPGGNYVLELESEPPREFPLRLEPEQALALTLAREAQQVEPREARVAFEYVLCEEAGGTGAPGAGSPSR